MTVDIDDLEERVREAAVSSGDRLSTLGLRISVELSTEPAAIAEVLREGPTERAIDELVLAKLSPRRRADKRRATRQRRTRVMRSRQNTPGTT